MTPDTLAQVAGWTVVGLAVALLVLAVVWMVS